MVLDAYSGGGRSSTDPKYNFREWPSYFLVAAFLLIVSLAGGLLNRVRGGWLRLPHLPEGDNSVSQLFLHDMLPRLIVFASPLGMAAAVTARRTSFTVFQRGLLALAVVVLTWTSLWVGWGTYMAVGRNSACFGAQAGVFDWLIGHCEATWVDKFTHRWVHDICGMSWRGLVQTAPLGFVFFHLGFGWELAFSGSLMGLLYDVGWRINSTASGFERGTPIAEVFWGAFIWCMTLVPLLAYREHPCRPFRQEGSPRWRQACLHGAFGVCMVVFLTSSIWYGIEVHQTDERTKNQTLAGMIVATIAMVVCHIVLAIRFFLHYHVNTPVGVTYRRLASDDENDDTADLLSIQGAAPSYAALSLPARGTSHRLRDLIVPPHLQDQVPWPWAGFLIVLRPLIFLWGVGLVCCTIVAMTMR